MRTVFVRPERCLGCRQCEFACAVAHSRTHDPGRAHFEEPPPRSRIHVEAGAAPHTSFPNRCRHCDPAPCMSVCPTGALGRNAQEDVVLVDQHRCIACALCAIVCPLGAVTFHRMPDGPAPRPTAVKCDGCIGRPPAKKVPACVYACKTGALLYGDINDLVRSGRIRESEAVLQAHTATAAPEVPAGVAAWRQWGRAATESATAREVGGVR